MDSNLNLFLDFQYKKQTKKYISVKHCWLSYNDFVLFKV